ncbi:hypothetical protein TrVGV298_007801 [Trichoderma virens]|nr:hypothetical protein TrVGV298_007801 [Trichoderma virens]
MEGSGIWDEFPCIIVKGICDYADSHNNTDWQNFAAATAASVVKGLIERYPKTDEPDTSLLANLSISAKIEDSKENRACLRDLHSTDPEDDKKRIQMTKGGLLRDSYAWILTNDAFQQWRNDPPMPPSLDQG